MSRYARRRFVNLFNLTAAAVVTALGLLVLAAILGMLCVHGLSALSVQLFTASTPPPGSAHGGLANAIVGSLLMTLMGTAIGTPVGLLAATYLAEYGEGSPLATLVRFINDVLLSAPSILIGLFIYGVAVVPTGHFSGWSGGLTLAVITIPVVVRTTEDMLRLVPASLREAAVALGAPRWKVVVDISYRAAGTGIMTGVLLSIARISGETAPLLFTALNNQFWSLNMNAPIANLPVVIFQFAMSPYRDWQSLAWAGAFLITAGILGLNLLARLLVGGRRGTS